MPETWTIKKVLTWTIKFFADHQVPDARLSAEILLAHTLKIKRIDLYLQFERILTGKELAQYRNYINRRKKQEPVQYITGEQDFMGMTFKVNSYVLIPRPETELLVERVLDYIQLNNEKSWTILDVGCGSGAIAISIARQCSRCQITAIDISSEAIRIAEENARNLTTPNIKFINGDIFKTHLEKIGKFDIIAINPPYIGKNQKSELHPQVREYEPEQALFAGEDGMEFYNRFISYIPEVMKDTGKLFMEIGYSQKKKISQLLLKKKFSNIQYINDYQKIPRVVIAQK